MSIHRPSVIRQRDLEARERRFQNAGMNPTNPEAAALRRAMDEADAVLAMIQSNGWKVVGKRLLEKRQALHEEVELPGLKADRVWEVRTELVGLRVVEDIISEVLRTGDKARGELEDPQRETTRQYQKNEEIT